MRDLYLFLAGTNTMDVIQCAGQRDWLGAILSAALASLMLAFARPRFFSSWHTKGP